MCRQLVPAENDSTNRVHRAKTNPITARQRETQGRQVYRRGRYPVNPLALIALFVVLTSAPAAADLQERLAGSGRLEEDLARLTRWVEAGRMNEVEVELEARRAVAERDSRWLNLWGLSLAARGDHEAAVARYSAGLYLDPDRAELHLNLAVSLVASGVTGRALSEFERATQLDPESPDAWLGLAEELLRLRRYRRGLEAVVEGRALAPGDLRLLRAEAKVADASRDLRAARRAWDELERIDPGADSARRLGELSRDEDPAAAIAHYDRCADRDSSAIDCLEAAAQLVLERGEPVEAVARLGPRISELSQVGLQNLYLGTWQGAGGEDVLRILTRRPPETAPAWGIAALARRRAEDRVGAMEAVKAGLALNAEDADLLTLEGVLHEESGNRDAARAAWRRALRSRGDHPEALANLEATEPR